MANTEKQVKNYIVRQTNWVKANNLKENDTVYVRKAHEGYSKGWENSWNSNMCFPKKLRVVDANCYIFGIYLSDGYCYPYTVLQKVE